MTNVFEYAPQMVSVDDLQPAVYNPREADELRLTYLTQSISYLGFVLPLYSTPSGHLLSGHQRLTVAKSLGCTHVPVVYVDVPEPRWKHVNLLFNRITNDMDNEDNSEIYLNQLQTSSLGELLSSVEPLDPTSEEFFPCMRPTYVNAVELAKHVKRLYSSHAVSSVNSAASFDIFIPALRSATDGQVINGAYRVYHATTYGADYEFPVIDVPEDRAAIAEALVNLISMRFTVEVQMKGVLRYGGYRRPTNKVDDLVRSMRYWADGKRVITASESLKNYRNFWHKFRKAHGESIVDMGAGQRRNGLILRQKGIECLDWEPYPCDWQGVTGDPTHQPSLTLARQITDHFLEEVGSGKRFSSVFANAVINSIPFYQDRVAFFAICHALCNFHTSLYGSARNAKMMDMAPTMRSHTITAEGEVHENYDAPKMFKVPYEENTLLADISRAPKVQKYHTRQELLDHLSMFWTGSDVSMINQGYLMFQAYGPRRVNPKALGRAIELQFNLPYPDATLDRVDQAKKAFSERLSVKIP